MGGATTTATPMGVATTATANSTSAIATGTSAMGSTAMVEAITPTVADATAPWPQKIQKRKMELTCSQEGNQKKREEGQPNVLLEFGLWRETTVKE